MHIRTSKKFIDKTTNIFYSVASEAPKSSSNREITLTKMKQSSGGLHKVWKK